MLVAKFDIYVAAGNLNFARIRVAGLIKLNLIECHAVKDLPIWKKAMSWQIGGKI